MRISLTLAAAGFVLAAPAAAATVEATIMQMENDWAAASVKKDYATIERVVAKDWSGQDDSTTKMTRAAFIAGLKSGEIVTKSEKVGPMTVKVMGDVAVVQGSEDEVSTYKGKDTSGKYNWMDVFARHDGTWQAVFTQVAKVKA